MALSPNLENKHLKTNRPRNTEKSTTAASDLLVNRRARLCVVVSHLHRQEVYETHTHTTEVGKTILGVVIIPTLAWVLRKHESERRRITIRNVFGCVTRASNSRRLGPSTL